MSAVVGAVERARPGGGPLATLERALSEFVEGFEPEVFSGPDATALMECFARIERLAAAGKAMAAARAADCGVWRQSGSRSAAEWMGQRTGVTVRDAAAQLTTAKRMRHLGEAAEAYRRGELSPPVAAAVAAGASADPSSEPQLLTAARAERVEVLKERAAETVRRASGDDRRRTERLWRSRSLRSWRDADGAYLTQLRLPPELGALFCAGWRRWLPEAEIAARDRRERCSPEMLAADAAVMMAQHHCREISPPTTPETRTRRITGGPGGERAGNTDGEMRGTGVAASGEGRRPALTSGGGVNCGSGGCVDCGDASGSASGGGGEHGSLECAAGLTADGSSGSQEPFGDTGSEVGHRDPGRRAPVQVIARVDLDALLRGHADGGEICEIAGVGPVPVSAIENLLGAATLALVLTRGVDVLNVCHLGRAATAHQRTALLWRDPTCVVDGCDEQLGLEIDHVTGWDATRVTRLDDLARLCRQHHALKTHRGWMLSPPDPTTGKRRLQPPPVRDTS